MWSNMGMEACQQVQSQELRYKDHEMLAKTMWTMTDDLERN